MKARPQKNIVGQNIRRIRQERSLTQEELALMSGLSQGYINQLESGKRKFTQKTLTVIAEALNLPLSNIADHYMRLMSIEKDIYNKKKG